MRLGQQPARRTGRREAEAVSALGPCDYGGRFYSTLGT
jgi:hypothetical protein